MIINQKFHDTIIKYQMLGCGSRVLLSVSGGSDSVCLTHLIKQVQKKYRLELHIMHFDHGLRKESEKDASFVKKLSATLNIPCTIKKINVRRFAREHKLSIEESGRKLRYEFLAEFAAKNRFNVIATGHTQDDQAETVLHNLIRGTGINGLCGIPPARQLTPKIKVVRPLIKVSKTEILDYLKKNNVSYMTDKTNFDTKFTRNYIRNMIIPLLEKINPGLKTHLSQLTEIIFREKMFWQTETDKIFSLVVTSRNNELYLDYNRFLKYNIILQNRIIERVLANTGDESYVHFTGLLDLIKNKPVGSQLTLGNQWQAEKQYHRNRLYKTKKSPDVKYKYNLKIPGVTKCPELDAKIVARFVKPAKLFDYKRDCYRAYFDYEQIKSQKLVVRNFQPGDWFYPFGMNGKKKLQDFFVDIKLDRGQRNLIPLVVCDNRVAWVVGYRTDNKTRVTETTNKVLELKYEDKSSFINNKNTCSG